APATATVCGAEYEPHGNVHVMRKGSHTEQPLRYPGQEAAMTWEGAEENYNIVRWYRGGWGRYTQADPVDFDGGINLYAHTLDNPTAATDALGLKRKCIHATRTNYVGFGSIAHHKPFAPVPPPPSINN